MSLMKTKIFLSVAVMAVITGCAPKPTKSSDTITDNFSYNMAGQGQTLQISFTKGVTHNHPCMAFWVEDENGNYIQTLFVNKSVGKGIFEHGSTATGKWEPDVRRNPALLPRWSHKRGVLAEDSLYIPSPARPVPDAYTGPTPLHHFVLISKLDKPMQGKICVFMEINQTWDWNEYWTNNKYPDDKNYKTSCQPALVYKAVIDLSQPSAQAELLPIGHSHYSGSDGNIDADLSTITTALKIAEKVTVQVVP